jgi:hypothetical protein
MEEIQDNLSVRRRNRLVSMIVAAIMALMFAGAFSLIMLK